MTKKGRKEHLGIKKTSVEITGKKIHSAHP